MGMRALIKQSVALAFKAAGDKKELAGFQTENATFDFTTNEVNTTPNSLVYFEVIIYKNESTKSSDKETIKTKATHHAVVKGAATKFSNFSKMIIGSDSYSILPEIEDYEEVSLIKLVKL